MRVLLTGATGFIGSNIAKRLAADRHDVFATYRNTSSFEKCIQFKDKIHWINSDNAYWKEHIIVLKPDYLIHTAWGGIGSADRDDWSVQLSNFLKSKEYFDLALESGVKKIIALGSQAEYGRYNFPVNEETVPKPDDAYGAVKTLCANYLRNLCENTVTEWYWIRIFSVFGEGDHSDWLIPSVIDKLLKSETVQLTSCNQRYNYFYIEEFINRLFYIIECKEDKSGIYNICNSESIIIRDLLLKIADLIGVSPSLLQFGKINQRAGQNMSMEGDNSKFRNSFYTDSGFSAFTDGLIKTIEYLKKSRS
jgi:nucleoside-diphosphate-sugar epimerase